MGTAATKHLRSFYSYRTIPRAYRGPRRQREDESEALERKVQAELTLGHDHFFHERYALALEAYERAYTLIHALLHPAVPITAVVHIARKLRGIDVLDSLLAASTQVARLRKAVGPRAPIVSPIDPPDELRQLIHELLDAGTGEPKPLARAFFEVALEYIRMGVVEEAEQMLARASELDSGEDSRLHADMALARGALMVQRDMPERGTSLFEKARDAYAELGDTTNIAALDNNLGVAHTLMGNVEAAGAAFSAAADRLPAAMGRSLTQPLNPGTVSAMDRPMGLEGLTLVLASGDSARSWVLAKPNVGSTAETRLGVMVDKQIVGVDLTADPVAELQARIYEPRVGALTLEALRTFEDLEGNFTAYLTHILGFTLPLSIGDCHFEMKEFDEALSWYSKARDYSYLNLAIEAPTVWVKTANAVLNLAHALYREGEKAAARVEYEKIVRLQAPEIDPGSPLYSHAPFAGMKAAVQALVAAPAPIDPDAHDPGVAVVVLLAKLNLQNLDAGIDFPLLSLQREESPVFTFDYLQNVARYFAEHAIQAERTYINFKTSAEQEEFTRSMLENAVALEQANEMLEHKKIQIAVAQRNAMQANLAHSQTQLANAQAMRADYQNVSHEEMALDAEITYVGAPTTEYDFSGYEEYGISDGTHRVDEVLRTLTQRRRELSTRFELRNMDRRITELQAAQKVAQAQVAIADAQVAAAQVQSQIATLRRQQSQSQLALFDSQEFTPDLWHSLANAIKAIAQEYLDQAIVMARLMEEVHEFETGEPADIIKPSYSKNELSGLLAGDFLLKDIDTFTFLRIVQAQKRQPMKEVISLADRFPLQFLREFQKTGVMNFRTELADFDRQYPGSYHQRIKRVEVQVEGLIGREGVHATLTDTGLALTRRRDGGVQIRLLKPETLLVSRYRIGQDSFVFQPAGEMLAVLEHHPVATSWILEVRPSANDLVFSYLTDVKLVLYYEAFFDSQLKQPVLEELAESQPLTGRRTVAIRYELFDEFFAFQDSGEVTFRLRETMLPFYHTDPRVSQLSLLIKTDEGATSAALTVHVDSAGTSAAQATTPDGAVSTGAGAPLDAFVGRPLLEEWTISIPEADNQAAFAAGFRWSQVSNIVLVAEYGFTPRRIEGEPYLVMRDDFEADPMGKFDVVDDASATQNAPSDWVYVAADQRVEQHSDIHGLPPGPPTGPAKPGTYLLRKTNGVPALENLILTANLSSADDDGIGLVFRYQDPDNFYFFLMDSQRGYRRLGKKVAGAFAELDTPALDETAGYDVGTAYQIRIRVAGASLQAYLDGEQILAGEDASIQAPGRVGFYCWANPGARFDDLQVVEL